VPRPGTIVPIAAPIAAPVAVLVPLFTVQQPEDEEVIEKADH
jgi:hypothetical protein